MFLQDPIFPLIMTVFTLFMVIIQSIQSEKLLKKSIALAFLNITIAIVVLIVYKPYIESKKIYEQVYSYYSIFVYVFYFVVFITSFKTSILKANHYQLFVKSIKESKWNAYYVVDKNERIKDISQSFLDEINMEKEEVIGKKLFNVFNKTIRFIQFNGTEINNRALENYYKEYRKKAQIGDDFVEEHVILNSEGKQVIFKLMMQPVFVLGKFKGRIVVGERKTDFDLLGVEKKLSESNKDLESIKLKFIATLEISKEGLFYIDLDQRIIWASDALVQILNLPDNTLELNDFRKLFHPEDLTTYLSVIGELSLSKQQYYLKYRILKDGNYIWVEERGKRIFDDHTTTTIMGTLNPINAKHFRSTNIEVLDHLGNYHELLVKMKKLIDKDNYFYVLLIELKNIPKINEEYGWEVGNMLMAEYINKMYSSFVTENGGVYRMSGLKFVVLITDPRKMDFVQKGIRSNETFLNLSMRYGSIQSELEVFAGVSVSKEDAVKEEHLYQAAEEALKIAKNPSFSHHGVFYKDLVNNE
ncbi:sensor domain-containing diguanylate cyclase [Haploplasma axanthum]|uniref:Diguanylate cyclase n=1 Tax=Haploplasma axanthum TaxID=29552 RepID=A0A449BBA3_HAPAX|nr:diguanylate cyclase [Haploplasma axanthum]VEU79631.1 diguanylate cyclase [Haploplasma axanthum]